MSNPNGLLNKLSKLLSQKVYHYLDQGYTLNNIFKGRTLNGLL